VVQPEVRIPYSPTKVEPAPTQQWRLPGLFAGLTLVTNLGMAWAYADAHRRLALDFVQVLLWLAVVAWAIRVERLSIAELGFRIAHLRRDLAGGLIGGFALAALACLFFRVPVVAPPLHYAGYASLDPASGLWVVGMRLLFTHALLEETLFRGLIQARATGWWGVSRGIAYASGLFALWHPVLTYLAIPDTTLATGPVPVWLWFLLSSLPLTVAGVIFGVVRQRTGSLVGPIAAHWSVNGVILAYLALAGMP